MLPTQNHEKIRIWAQRNAAVPAEIKPIKFDGEPSILHFLFGKEIEGTPEIVPISWENFFARFDLLGLSVLLSDSAPEFQIVRVMKKASPGTLN